MTAKKQEIVDPKAKGKREDDIARLALAPSVNAATTIDLINGKKFGGLQLGSMIKELKIHFDATATGDLARSEAMLVAQAHTLDALFHKLIAHSVANLGEYIASMETYMRLALKAQNQCQATLRTLGEIKSPKSIAFVKQANIAHNQQVNNGGAVQSEPDSPAQENKKQQNELLEDNHGQRLDSRAQATAASINPELETVAAINRAK